MSTEANVDYKEEDVIGLECKHVIHTESKSFNGEIPDDLHLVKEVVHLKDDRKIPKIRLIKNFERPFYITKEGFRNHEEKKEWEDIDKLQKFMSTQAGLPRNIMRALNRHGNPTTLKRLGMSPYLYGSDIKSTAIIKQHYIDRWGVYSENNVAVLDIETDVVNGTDDPILISVTMKDKSILIATEAFVSDIDDYETVMCEYFYRRLEEEPELIKHVKPRNINLIVKVAKNPLRAIEMALEKCHEWMPDFVAIWNINFDIPRIIETIEKYGGNAADIFSDPSVPPKYRKVWYKEGPAKKIAASGREEALHWADRWHTLYAPASFYVIDQGCVFRKRRVAKGREPSYALDYILKKHAGTKKLKNDLSETMTGLEWHIHMQKNEKLEYGVYNQFDCISCEVLDEQPKVGDLRIAISVQMGSSDYSDFTSQPRQLVDDLHFKCLSLGKVIASTPSKMETEFDKLTVKISGWIITLPAHLVVDNGLKIIDECPELNTLIRIGVYDLDIVSAYPSGEVVLNCSKETTIAERISIKGVPEDVARAASINLTGGEINAVEICCSVMKAPTLEHLIADYEKYECDVLEQE